MCTSFQAVYNEKLSHSKLLVPMALIMFPSLLLLLVLVKLNCRSWVVHRSVVSRHHALTSFLHVDQVWFSVIMCFLMQANDYLMSGDTYLSVGISIHT